MIEEKEKQKSQELSLVGGFFYVCLMAPLVLFSIFVIYSLFFAEPEISQQIKNWLVRTTILTSISLITWILLARMLGSVIAIWIIIIQSILHKFRKES